MAFFPPRRGPIEKPMDWLLRHRGKTDSVLILLSWMCFWGFFAGWPVALILIWANSPGEFGTTLLRYLGVGLFSTGVAVSFLAASAGSAVRSKIDHSPLLMELLVTPLSGRDMVNAMKRRSRQVALAGGAMISVAALGFFAALIFTGTEGKAALKETQLIVFALVLEPDSSGFSNRLSASLCAVAATIALFLSFSAGAALRAASLARLSHHTGKIRVYGAVLTAALLLAVIVSLLLRTSLIGILINDYFGRDGFQFLAIAVVEIPVALSRVYTTRRIWRQTEEKLTRDFDKLFLEGA